MSKYIFEKKKTINIGMLGTIYLMNWSSEEIENIQKPYFCVYIPFEKTLDKVIRVNDLFTTDIQEDNFVNKDSFLNVILDEYIDKELSTESKHLYTEPEDALFNVFERLYEEKKLLVV